MKSFATSFNGGNRVTITNRDGPTTLHDAARARSWSVVLTLLDEGAHVTTTDQDGRTALHHAARAGSCHVVWALLNNGADATTADEDGRTALHDAAEAGSNNSIWILLTKGADIAATDKHGQTALHSASRAGSNNSLQTLLKYRANIAAVDKGGRTALHNAARAGSDSTVWTLLERGANATISDNDGRTALHEAARAGSNDTLWALLNRGADISLKDHNGWTALHDAAQAGSDDTVWTLLNRGADINAVNNDGRTALHNAARAGSDDTLWTLISNSANINASDKDGRTALYDALQANSHNSVYLLLEAGADVNTVDKNGRTALHNATLANSDEICRKLIELGADVNTVDKNGRTALHNATLANSHNSVYLLLEAGADVNAVDKNGQTALHNATLANSDEICQKLIELGADVNTVDKNGRTALHNATLANSHNSVYLLLEAEADVNAVDKNGQTALHNATLANSDEICRKLIELGADVNAIDHQEKLSLTIALEQAQIVIAALLIKSGAKVDIPWDHGGDGILFMQAEQEWRQPSPKISHSSLIKLMAMLAPHLNLSFQPMWRTYIVCQWEMPQVLCGIINSAKPERVYDILAKFVVITGTSNMFDCSTCEEFLVKTWKEIGLDALRIMSQLLETILPLKQHQQPSNQSSIPPVVLAGIAKDHIALVLEDPQYNNKSLIEAVEWLCSAVRPLPIPPNDSNESLYSLQKSKVFTTDTSFKECHLLECLLSKLEPIKTENVGSQNCWVRLFRSAVVAWWPIERDWGEGLELPFHMLVELAAVENCVLIPHKRDVPDGKIIHKSLGYLLTGYFTALIPTDQNIENNSIQWHIEYSDSIVNPQELVSSQAWTAIQDFNFLQKARCFLGWSDPVDILLGTRHLDYKVRWSRSDECKTVQRAEGTVFGAELGLGDFIPISPKIMVEREYIMHSVVQSFTRQSQYDKAILQLSKQVGFVFDTSTERAWLVPLLSLILHLCHAYFSHFSYDPNIEDPIPFANPQPDGARAAMDVLKNKGDQTVLEGITLGNILLDIYTNMKISLKTREDPNGRTLFASEAMDQLLEPLRGSPLKSKKLGSQSRAWLSLVEMADFVCFCGNLGQAMRPRNQDPAKTCQCHELPPNEFFLAAHNSCLELLMLRKGAKLETLQNECWEINEKEFLFMQEWPFDDCSHDPLRPFWSNCVTLLQISQHKFSKSSPGRNWPGLVKPPKLTGAVVFKKSPLKLLKKSAR